MKLSRLSPDKYDQWDSFLLNHPDSTFFHLTKWMKILEDYGFGEPFYLFLEEPAGIMGVLPLYLVYVFPLGRGLISILDCNGPLIQNNEQGKDYFKKSLQMLEEEAKKQNICFVKLRLQASSPLNSFIPTSYVKYNEYCTFILDLEEGAEKIFKNRFDKKTRNAIRKAIKLGLESNEKPPTVDTYWRFYEETMIRSRGILDKRKVNLFRIIWDRLEYGRDFITLTAMFKGKPIAGIIAFLFKDSAYVWYNASLSKFLHMNPNEFLYWKLIEKVVDMGFKYLDFGPTPLRPSEGHFLFKSHFGGIIMPFNDYAYFPSKLRYFLIEGGALRLAKKLDIRRKIPRTILQKMGRQVIF